MGDSWTGGKIFGQSLIFEKREFGKRGEVLKRERGSSLEEGLASSGKYLKGREEEEKEEAEEEE